MSTAEISLNHAPLTDCTKNTTPAVSVIVASYNYADYVEKTVRSVLNQTFRDLEVVAVDDGSSDSSLSVLHRLAEQDPRVRVFTHPDAGNHGLPDTLRLGLTEAHGEYVAFLESDDLWQPQCLELRMAALAAHPEAEVVFNAVEPLPMPGADTGWFDSYVPRIMAEHAQRGTQSFRLDTALLLENKIPTFSCAMLRRERLLACDFQTPVPRWLDWWLWMQVALQCRFVFVPEPLTRWRLHTVSYNHKVELPNYLTDSRALWLAFRGRFLNHFRAHAPTAALMLRLPYQVRLGARLCLTATQSSPLETFRRIRGRFK